MANYDGSLVFDTKVDTSGMQNGLGKLGSVAKAGAQVAVTAIAAIGTALVGASAAAIKFGAEFEQSAAKASTLFGDVAVDTANLNSKILELSSSTGVAATELNEALYSALSAGIPATEDMAEATGFLESSTKLAKAGFTDIDTALSATAKTLNAYGMDVSETDKIQGILIQTQNKGITTVNELGASLAQVTPTAAAFGVSFENVGAALATMTAQGTPTAQATTQLNSLIAELGKSGTIAAKNLEKAAAGSEYAGKSFAEMMDSGASLNDVLSLMQKMADKSGLKMVDMFSSIEAGKSAMSIATKSGTVFNDNLKAMANTAGVVDDAYEKVTDTFEGQSAKMIQSAKNLGIAFYDNLKTPLKEAAKEGSASLDALSKSISSGALKPSMDKLGQAVASLVSGMIELATNAIPVLVNAFSFIVEHGNLIISILTGIVVGMAAFKMAMMMQQVIATWQTATLQLALYSAANGAAALSAAALNGTLTLGEIVVGVLTGKITLATAAQALWNAVMMANPVGVIIGLVAALAVGIGILISTMQKQKTEADIFIETQQGKIKSIQEEKQAYADLKAQQDENAASNLVEIANAERLWGELKNLADENGNVLESNRNRAAFILGELNSAMGTEYSLIGNQIQGYRELLSSIDELIAKKKAQILLEAQEPVYKEALLKVNQAQVEQAKQSIVISEKEQNVSRISGEIAQERAKKATLASTTEIEASNRKIRLLEENLGKEKEGLSQAQKAYSENELKLRDYYSDIDSYETASAEILQGNVEAAISTLQDKNSAFVTAADVAEKSAEDQKTVLEQQVIDTEVNARLMRERYNSGVKGVTEDMVRTAEEQATTAKTEFEKIGGNITDGIADGAESKQGSLWSRIAAIARGAVDAAEKALDINSPSRVMRDEVGVMISEGIAEGIEDGEPAVQEAIEEVAEVALTAQEFYTQEQKRIEEKRAAQSAAASEKEYQERLKNAKKSTEKEKIKQERILALEKEADDKYLEELKDKADKENEARDNELADLKYQLDMREITEDEYYNRLAEFRDKHFKEGSKEWRSYNKEVVDYNLNSMLRNLKNSLDMHVITEAEYYKELESYRDQYFQEGSQEWQSYTQEIYNYNQSVLENVKSSVKATWDEIAQQAASQSEAVASSIQNMSQKLKDYGGSLFETSTITFKGEGPGYVLNENGAYQMVEDRVITQSNLRDLTQDIDTLKEYESALMGVKKRNEEMFGKNGVPDGFFEMMRNMGVEDGLAFAKTLLDSSNASYEKFISDWTEKQKTADSISEVLYGDEKEAADEVKKYWEEVGDSLNTQLEQMGIEVPEGFFDIGTDSAENFAKGFKQTIETALNDITKTINSVSASVTPQFSAQLGDAGYTAPDATRVYNYYLVPSSDSVRDQIEEIQKFDERKKLKGD